jgi:hypothetical protein
VSSAEVAPVHGALRLTKPIGYHALRITPWRSCT